MRMRAPYKSWDPKGEVQATVHLEEDWGYSGWWDNQRFEIYKLSIEITRSIL